ncbi:MULTISPECIES: cytochrome c [Rhodomicrobium]|uniref:cytochrome c n=1 Tax=Rhodomicrobium TaxID=1068 RepID=UPI000B4B9162|nr:MULTISPECIES: cytochrome c [Rhodomicrobium]
MTRVAPLAFLGMLTIGGWPAASAEAPDQALAEKGRYVAIAADCRSCHTADKDQPFAGGVALRSAFGTLLTPNITPDKETGIGGWTREDFQRAIREGKSKAGKPLYPAMPYTSYTKMSDEDLDALWAFMQTVKPVRHEVQVNQLPFPFNVRSSLYAWQALFFEAGRFKPDANADAEFNRGAYLVEALAHCSACHTPRNALGAEIPSEMLKGARIEEWYAPNISNDANSSIRNWTHDELVDFLRGHERENRIMPFGQMIEVVDESLSQLQPYDISAIADYLQNRDAGKAGPEPASAALSPERKAAGLEVYQQQCANCHGENGEGVAGVAAKLAGNTALTGTKPYNILSVLLEGIEPRGIWGKMPSFAQALSDQQLADVTNYVGSSWGNQAADTVGAGYVNDWRGAVLPPTPALERSLPCLNVPDDRLDDQVRAELDALGAAPVPPEKARSIFGDYSRRFPQLSYAERVTALSGTYCNTIVPKLPNRSAVINQELQFMDALGGVPIDKAQDRIGRD